MPLAPESVTSWTSFYKEKCSDIPVPPVPPNSPPTALEKKKEKGTLETKTKSRLIHARAGSLL
jgi:hypothetical protein